MWEAMNAEGTKRLALIKSLVREQGADGDKCWLIVQLETESLEAGVRIAELEALFALQQTRMTEAIHIWQEATGKQDVLPDLGDLLAWLMARPAALEALARKLQKVLSICRERLQHDKAQKAKRSGAGTSISLRKVDHLLGIISAALVESQAGKEEPK